VSKNATAKIPQNHVINKQVTVFLGVTLTGLEKAAKNVQMDSLVLDVNCHANVQTQQKYATKLTAPVCRLVERDTMGLAVRSNYQG